MKVFIAGPRAISKLNADVIKRLDKIMSRNLTVLVGDASGVDKAVQNFLHERNFQQVVVYASGTRTRNNIGNWTTEMIESPKNIKGFDFYTIKDKKMAEDADCGLMIWNGKSKGTFNNILNLIKFNKTVMLYLTPLKKFYKLKEMHEVEKLISCIDNPEINNFYSEKSKEVEQLTFDTEDNRI